MFADLTLERMVKRIQAGIDAFPDPRTGQNTQYAMRDAGMGAFSVFFPQSPSFLAQQRRKPVRDGAAPQ